MVETSKLFNSAGRKYMAERLKGIFVRERLQDIVASKGQLQCKDSGDFVADTEALELLIDKYATAKADKIMARISGEVR